MQNRALTWLVAVICALTVSCVGGGCKTAKHRLPPAFEAASLQDTSKLLGLIAGGVSVNSQDDVFGATLLMWALRFGATNSISALIEAGADVNLRDKAQNTALMYCARLGDYGVTVSSNLVALGANVNITNSVGQTPLARAVRSSNTPLIQFLVTRGALADVRDGCLSRTIVMLAASLSDIETLDLVCSLTQCLIDARDQHGNSTVRYALDDGPQFQRKLDVLIRHGYEVNLANRSGETPLIVASKRCDLDAVKALMSNGANPDSRDLTGKTAIDWAIEKQCGEMEKYLRQLQKSVQKSGSALN